MGKITKKLENKLSKIHNCKYCIVTNSGTSALLLSVLSLELKKNDEILIPAQTWIATAQAASITGCKIRLIDVKKDSPVLNEQILEKVITKKTKVIIPVHFHGHRQTKCQPEKHPRRRRISRMATSPHYSPMSFAPGNISIHHWKLLWKQCFVSWVWVSALLCCPRSGFAKGARWRQFAQY